jgi:hypothetical protein
MIRTTVEAPFFGLWRDAAVLRALARPQYLTTARYEPILHHQRGGGHVDLLFESGEQSCILGGIRLDARNLITRERSPFVWPAHLAAMVDHLELFAIERSITPWLRSMARAHPMATESIRRFAPSDRFDRARDADLLGAAPLERTMRWLAPFVYARRFAANAHVLIACADGVLAQAVLGDVAAGVERAESDTDDDAFARAWYGTPAQLSSTGTPDIVIAGRRGSREAAVVLETEVTDDSLAAIIEVPSPVPWDLLFSFDSGDAPAASRFGVYAVEPAIRECVPLLPAGVIGGSSGSIVLAVSAEALTMRGGDMQEAEILGRRLRDEGFRVHIASKAADQGLADVWLIHIFGSRFESHTVAFAKLALQRGVGFIFDVPPIPADPSAFVENNLSFVYGAALDDAEVQRYMLAYDERRLDAPGPAQPIAEDYVRIDAQFAELTRHAVGVLAAEEDLETLRAALPPGVGNRIRARGVFAQAEPVAGAIGHLVPRAPFAFAHGAIAAQSHFLYAAVAAERLGVPFVVAGPLYDLDYLQVLRAKAPSAIVLAEADAHTVSALYRRAAIWVDAAPRPRSIACLMRAISCGALPVLATESPLSRIAAGDAPTFSLASIDDCARVMLETMASSGRHARIVALQARLLPRCDPTSALAGIMAAYAGVASTV